MGSQVLPQALHMIPRGSSQCLPSKKLGFSTVFCRSPFVGHRVLVSRTSAKPIGWNLGFLVNAPVKESFVVRAESNEVEASESVEERQEDTVEAEGDAVDAEAEVEVEEEEEEAKAPRTPRVKLGDIMGILNNRAIEASEKERPIPEIRTGDVVEIKLEVPENRRRLSIYKGIVMSRQNAGIHTTIRIRRIIAGIGVEIVFPLYSPNIKEIRVVSHRKVRRARLYYLRDKLPRLSTFK
ncbi:50S ribosomal protein L19, chloroplastic [Melia azedarach]|uniref:50S ribosomal protein L19, chloroplastic n=1 Tax=Melia azedarach TaxID=155640 RepID=A0ACC1XPJ7_MELAZ|nr:50S ribosomal protein L19, chloroplastic [Melia azedarach]